jgi:hypothetical protein
MKKYPRRIDEGGFHMEKAETSSYCPRRAVPPREHGSLPEQPKGPDISSLAESLLPTVHEKPLPFPSGLFL